MKYLTLENIRDQVKADNGWSGVTTYDTRIDNAAGHAIDELQNEADFEWLIRQFAIPTVGGTEKYALPYDFRKEVEDTVFYGVDKIDRIDKARLAERRDGSGSQGGTPVAYCVAEQWPVTAQPSAAGTIAFLGTTANTVTVRGISSGAEVYEEVAVSAVRAATSNSYTEIFAVSKTRTAGLLTMYNDADVIGYVPEGAIAQAYPILGCDPIPDGAGTISGDYYRDLTAALQVGEAVPIPTSFERLLKRKMAMYVDYLKKDWESHRVDAAQYLHGRDQLIGRKREPQGLVHPKTR